MSRIGKQPITLPKGVEVKMSYAHLEVKGPKGVLGVPIDPDLKLVLEGSTLQVERPTDQRRHRSLHGLTRTLVANAVQGVSEGYSREMSIKGIGYRAKLSGKNLELSVGYSHPVVVEPPQGIAFEVPEPTKIFIRGIDKQLVGQIAANVRGIRKPSAYHEKGIYYAGETIKLKPGKAGSK